MFSLYFGGSTYIVQKYVLRMCWCHSVSSHLFHHCFSSNSSCEIECEELSSEVAILDDKVRAIRLALDIELFSRRVDHNGGYRQ
jgi:hypothetical protein